MVAKEEAVAVIQARGDCGLDLSGGSGRDGER